MSPSLKIPDSKKSFPPQRAGQEEKICLAIKFFPVADSLLLLLLALRRKRSISDSNKERGEKKSSSWWKNPLFSSLYWGALERNDTENAVLQW